MLAAEDAKTGEAARAKSSRRGNYAERTRAVFDMTRPATGQPRFGFLYGSRRQQALAPVTRYNFVKVNQQSHAVPGHLESTTSRFSNKLSGGSGLAYGFAQEE
jgi:hypothetical protein